MLGNLKSFWLTLNRACQLRCTWCYAETNKFDSKDNLDINLAFKIVDFCSELGLTRCTLLGGEPTLYKNLLMLLRHGKECGIEVGIVSNGLRFSDMEFAREIKDWVNGVTISLKAGKRDKFLEITGSSKFEQVVEGIRNLKKLSVPFNVSVLLSRQLEDQIVNAIKLAALLGVPFVQVDTCNPTISRNVVSSGESYDPLITVQKTIELYDSVSSLPVKVNFALRSPFCLYPKDFIQRLRDEDRLISGCQLHRQDGIIFGTKGEIIPCNLMCDHSLGVFGKNFFDHESFSKFLEGQLIQSFYTQTRRLPSEKCDKCSDYRECCGGCLIKWMNYDPADYI